jgi:hypothetical protein
MLKLQITQSSVPEGDINWDSVYWQPQENKKDNKDRR